MGRGKNTILFETESLCPYCLQRIPARYKERDGEVYIEKECREHGSFRTLFWRDAELFKKWHIQAVHAEQRIGKKKGEKGCPYDCGLCTEHEGGVCTAVLEITYRCNMECAVCFADATKGKFEPTIDEIRHMYETAYLNGGYCSIQLSGGEPTMRSDLPDIIALGKSLGFPHIQVNTNGLKLAGQDGYAQTLKDAGADLIYLQFDGCSDGIYQKIRKRKLLDIKIQALENCRQAGLGVLLVPTIIPGININCVGEIIAFAKRNMPTVRGVHFQLVSYFGRYPGDVPKDDQRASLADVMHALEEQTAGEIQIKDLVPRKRYAAHCAFSGLFFLTEEGILKAITREEQNALLCGKTDFAGRANKFTNLYWRGSSMEQGNRQNAMARFRARLRDYTLAVSGMGFQDAWNIDIGRLRGCCVSVITSGNQAVPLCAFHLTSVSGERLYQNE